MGKRLDRDAGAWSRRGFLRAVVAGAAAGSPGSARPSPPPKIAPILDPEWRKEKSLVVRVRSEEVVAGSAAREDLVQSMVDRAVRRLAGKGEAREAWRAFARPGQKVAIKYNGLFRLSGTDPAIVHAIARSLVRAGIGQEDITVFEWHPNRWFDGIPPFEDLPRIRMRKSDEEWTDPMRAGGMGFRLTAIIAGGCDVLINVPRLKHHCIAGLTQALKNHLGSIPNPQSLHGAPHRIADLNALEPIRTKTRLIIVDALRPMFDQGPHYLPRFTWKYGAILASRDPVAVDRIGEEILLAYRHGRRIRGPIRPPIRYLDRAQELGLGNADRGRIDLVDA